MHFLQKLKSVNVYTHYTIANVCTKYIVLIVHQFWMYWKFLDFGLAGSYSQPNSVPQESELQVQQEHVSKSQVQNRKIKRLYCQRFLHSSKMISSCSQFPPQLQYLQVHPLGCVFFKSRSFKPTSLSSQTCECIL